MEFNSLQREKTIQVFTNFTIPLQIYTPSPLEIVRMKDIF